MTVNVEVSQITVRGKEHAIWITEHPLPLPTVGDYIYYGCHLKVLSVIYHYKMNSDGHRKFSHVEIEVE